MNVQFVSDEKGNEAHYYQSLPTSTTADHTPNKKKGKTAFSLIRLSEYLVDNLDIKEKTKLTPKKLARLNTALNFIKATPKSRIEIISHIGLKNHTSTYTNYIKLLESARLLEKTNKTSPNASNQQYQLTTDGKRVLGLGEHPDQSSDEK